MTDNSEGHGHHPKVQAYIVVFGALAIFTIISFVVNYFVREYGLNVNTGFLLILGVAVVKATLVGAYFMHLVWDWKKVGFMIVPAFILGAMMMFVLMPDIVLAWHVGE